MANIFLNFCHWAPVPERGVVESRPGDPVHCLQIWHLSGGCKVHRFLCIWFNPLVLEKPPGGVLQNPSILVLFGGRWKMCVGVRLRVGTYLTSIGCGQFVTQGFVFKPVCFKID